MFTRHNKSCASGKPISGTGFMVRLWSVMKYLTGTPVKTLSSKEIMELLINPGVSLTINLDSLFIVLMQISNTTIS